MPLRPRPALVGRAAELEHLLDLLASGDAAVLLGGDAGVGKTRLLLELRDRAEADGVRVHPGHCLDFGEGALPYLPFSEILGRLVDDESDAVGAVMREHPALAGLLPGRRMRDADDARGDGRRDLDAGVPVDRGELFAAVHALFTHVAETAPLLVIIEDLHWADRSTRELLSYLFTRPFEGAVGLVCSYRADDLHRRHPLRRQVAEWARLRSVERIALEPLSDADVRTLVARLQPAQAQAAQAAQLDETFVEGIVERAEGNAFFVEELVGALGSTEVPGDLAEVLLVRLDGLDEAARSVVRAASVAGRRVAHDALAHVTGMAPADLDQALRSAVEFHVLAPAGDDYAFRHALLAEATYDDLLPGERVGLHTRYVEAIRDGRIRASAAELVRHARAANDLDTALVAAVEAGDDAMTVGGPDDAADHYEAALTLLTDAARETVDGVVDRSRLAVRAADALALSGRSPRAAQVVQEQLGRLAADAPAAHRARLLSRLSKLLLVTEGEQSALDLSTEAAGLLDEEISPLHARVLASHAHVLSAYGRYEEAGEVGMVALDVAEKLDLPDLRSDVLTTLLWMKRATSKEAVRASLTEAVTEAERSGASEAELRARYLLGRDYQDHAEFDQAATWFESAMELGRSTGRPWQTYAIESRWQWAWIAMLNGDAERVRALTDVSGEGPPPITQGLFDALALQQALWSGEPVDREVLRSLRTMWAEEGLIAVHSAAVEIDLAGAAADADAAMAAYAAVVEVLGRIWHPWFSGRIRLAALTLGALNSAAAVTPSDGLARLAARGERLFADGAESLRRYADPTGHWGPEGQAWAKRLEAEAVRLRWLTGIDPPEAEDLVRFWREAETLFADLGHVPELARVRVVLAGVLRAVGDPGAARDVAASAGTPAVSVAHEVALTPRELEILALVAAGGTNGQIGTRLYISTKTVSVHVSRILAKLGAASRTEAAAIGRRQGLVPDE